MDNQWGPDVLGKHFEQRTLDLGDGIVATLVRFRPAFARRLLRPRCVVLYVHGWSDYFFQSELAHFWHRNGAAFYALDLHNYGRSLRPGLVPGLVTDLEEYDKDLEAALAQIVADLHQSLPVILMGHSTGGLTVSLWASRHPGAVSALVLNSPWLEFQATGPVRRLLTPILGLEARRHPLAPLPPMDHGYYARAVLEAFEGELEYNEDWRPRHGFPVTLAFLYAVMDGQATVQDGLNLHIPVLVLLSDKSHLQPAWSEETATSDIALNVEAVAHRALSLGEWVTVVRIKNAMHDVILSTPETRQLAYRRIEQWFGAYSAVRLKQGNRSIGQRTDFIRSWLRNVLERGKGSLTRKNSGP